MELVAQGRILAGVSLGDGEDGGCWVDGGDASSTRQAGGAFSENAPAAADVEVGEAARGGSVGLGAVACADEVVAKRVHEVEEAR